MYRNGLLEVMIIIIAFFVILMVVFLLIKINTKKSKAKKNKVIETKVTLTKPINQETDNLLQTQLDAPAMKTILSKCPYCGNKVLPTDIKCPSCGARQD